MANKYGNVPTMVGVLRFASKAEANRYKELKLLERGARIRNLELHPEFPLIVNGKSVGKYIGDFRYQRFDKGTWLDVTEDVKGVETAVFRLKARLVKVLYGITIEIVRNR